MCRISRIASTTSGLALYVSIFRYVIRFFLCFSGSLLILSDGNIFQKCPISLLPASGHRPQASPYDLRVSWQLSLSHDTFAKLTKLICITCGHFTGNLCNRRMWIVLVCFADVLCGINLSVTNRCFLLSRTYCALVI